MKHGFLFTYIKNYSSPLPKKEAMARVRKALAGGCVVNTTPIKVSKDSLSFYVKRRDFRNNAIYFKRRDFRINTILTEEIFYNPEVTVQFKESNTGTEVQTICRLKPEGRVPYCLAMIFMVFVELFFCFIRLHGQTLVLSCFLILYFNFVFLGLPHYLILRFFYSKDVLYVIQNALQPDESNF